MCIRDRDYEVDGKRKTLVLEVQQQGLVEFRVKVQAACGEGSQGFSVIAVTQGHLSLIHICFSAAR